MCIHISLLVINAISVLHDGAFQVPQIGAVIEAKDGVLQIHLVVVFVQPETAELVFLHQSGVTPYNRKPKDMTIYAHGYSEANILTAGVQG